MPLQAPVDRRCFLPQLSVVLEKIDGLTTIGRHSCTAQTMQTRLGIVGVACQISTSEVILRSQGCCRRVVRGEDGVRNARSEMERRIKKQICPLL
ncbi:hypothetical protein ElyMa_006307900 [Elysia marginata]|uniref:Uncharacterized protein n=1 Tax=Elysia marginata TaxID=1093978 RepID=A0AAV4HF70_9GAST|nr:hypothetical protein ElyMa_006307900 [Elysia marginata]